MCIWLGIQFLLVGLHVLYSWLSASPMKELVIHHSTMMRFWLLRTWLRFIHALTLSNITRVHMQVNLCLWLLFLAHTCFPHRWNMCFPIQFSCLHYVQLSLKASDIFYPGTCVRCCVGFSTVMAPIVYKPWWLGQYTIWDLKLVPKEEWESIFAYLHA